MIVQLLLVLALFVVVLGFGAVSGRVLRVLGLGGESRPTAIILLGLVSLAVVALWLSLLFPITRMIQLGILSVGLISCAFFGRTLARAFRREGVRWSLSTLTIAIVVSLVPVLMASMDHFFYDAGLYYGGSIAWLQQHGTVIGLGNLHDRFGYASGYWPLAALVSPGPAGPFPYLVFLIILLIFLVVRHSLVTGFRPHFLGVLPLFLFFYKGQISAAAPDGVVAVLFLILVFVLIDDDFEAEAFTPLGAVGLACLAVAFKATAAPLLLMAGFLFLRSENRKPLVAVSAIIIVPYLIRNLLLTGYFAYPVLSVGIPVDWQIPIEQLRATNAMNKAWARIPQVDTARVLTMPLKSWVPLWFERHHVALKALLLLGPVCGLVALPAMARRSMPMIVSLATALLGIALWLVIAPDPRFFMGFLLFALVAPAEWIDWQRLLASRSRLLIRVGAGALIVVFIAMLILFIRAYPQHLLLPPTLPEARVQVVRAAGFEVLVPADGSCFAAKLPCTPSLSENLRLRGNSLGQGFILAKPAGAQ